MKLLCISLYLALMLAAVTSANLRRLEIGNFAVVKPQVLDAEGNPLAITRANDWNLHNQVSLSQVPDLVVRSFIAAEDRRFFQHSGIDWYARFAAIWQNTKSLLQQGRAVRGASTIAEQSVRMLNPRPRTLWSRWLEGFEAQSLLRRYGHGRILQFYLNQVPFYAQRRGVVEAAHYYFGRSLETLNQSESLALAIMVRGPAFIKPGTKPLAQRLSRLEAQLGLAAGEPLSEIKAGADEYAALAAAADYALQAGRKSAKTLKTTIVPYLQRFTHSLLTQRLAQLQKSGAAHGAGIILDAKTGAILVMAAAGDTAYNPTVQPRQPGSALKPFLYGLAFENGWHPARILDDSPLSTAVANGMHVFHNYSRRFYGKVSLRTALANSLNIPAVLLVQAVGNEPLLAKLHQLGFDSLKQPSQFYGDGLALGNGEVTLLELAQAYTAFANRGIKVEARILQETPVMEQRVWSSETAALITDILADEKARELEFLGPQFRFSSPVAVKTGTSTDYRDALAVGYNNDFVVALWLGNLNGKAMDGVSGSSGPGQILKAVFSELHRRQPPRALYLAPTLVKRSVCIATTKPCEWVREFVPQSAVTEPTPEKDSPVIEHPTPGLILALDPRVAPSDQAYEFSLRGAESAREYSWYLNNKLLRTSHQPKHLWRLAAGSHSLRVEWRDEKGLKHALPEVPFSVVQ